MKEKELTRARDALAAERRRMPRMAVEKDYRFEGPNGPASLLDLFEGRRQLVVYRHFFEPGVDGWPEKGCPGCSMMAAQDAHPAHLNARDTTLAYVSRAPQPDIERLKARTGWQVPWYTLTDDFDADFGVDEWHGTNAFFRDGDRIFRTYFVNGRGDEALGSTFSYLDITALGRQEDWEDSPEGYPQTPQGEWWRLRTSTSRPPRDRPRRLLDTGVREAEADEVSIATKRRRFVALFVPAGVCFVAACGSGEEEAAPARSASPAATATAVAAANETVSFPLKQEHRSGRSGKVTLKGGDDGFTVALRVKPKGGHPAHIHDVTCQEYRALKDFDAQFATVDVPWTMWRRGSRRPRSTRRSRTIGPAASPSTSTHTTGGFPVVACADIPAG